MNMPANQFGNNLDLFAQMAPWGSQMGATYQDAPMAVDPTAMTPFQEQYLAQNQQLIDAQTPSGFQKGIGTFGTITQGLASLGNIYMGLKGLKLQKEAFNFNKGVTNTNLNNSIMDYNRRLEDTLANRSLNNGQGQGWVSQQLAKYSAKRS